MSAYEWYTFSTFTLLPGGVCCKKIPLQVKYSKEKKYRPQKSCSTTYLYLYPCFNTCFAGEHGISGLHLVFFIHLPRKRTFGARTFENQLHPITLANTGQDVDGEWLSTTVSKMAVCLHFSFTLAAVFGFVVSKRRKF